MHAIWSMRPLKAQAGDGVSDVSVPHSRGRCRDSRPEVDSGYPQTHHPDPSYGVRVMGLYGIRDVDPAFADTAISGGRRRAIVVARSRWRRQ